MNSPTKERGLGLASNLPPELEAVALVDVRFFAAVGSVSVSWVHSEVRAGRAPAPVMRATRCTRWRRTDVLEFWRKRAEMSAEGAATAALAQSRAEKASARARAIRNTAKPSAQPTAA